MDHHYVPRFYLARFNSEPNHLPYYKGELWVADIHRRRTWHASPRRVAHRPNFYDTETPLVHLASLESYYKLIEDMASRALATLSSPRDWASCDAHSIMHFIALQVSRTPLGHERMKEQVTVEMVERLLASKVLGGALLNIDIGKRPEAMNKLFEFFKKLEPDRDLVLLNAAQRPAVHLFPLLKGACWHWIAADEDEMLLTSDNPAVLFDNQDGHEPALSKPTRLHLYFPASPRFGLLACFDGETCSRPSVHGLSPKVFNNLVILNAQDGVYCSTKKQAQRVIEEGIVPREKSRSPVTRL